tara:strand:- start:429 stop:1073 length:645 start_codon:yes stop_codon:yes gene_type:complete
MNNSIEFYEENSCIFYDKYSNNDSNINKSSTLSYLINMLSMFHLIIFIILFNKQRKIRYQIEEDIRYIDEDNEFLADSNKNIINAMKKLKEYIKNNYDKNNEIVNAFEKFQDTQVKMEDNISNIIMDISQETTRHTQVINTIKTYHNKLVDGIIAAIDKGKSSNDNKDIATGNEYIHRSVVKSEVMWHQFLENTKECYIKDKQKLSSENFKIDI